MIVEVRVPSVGESVTEGLLSRWMREDGAQVAVDEPLFELETDKVSSEIPSPAAGILRRGAGEGTTVVVGAVVATIDTNGAANGDARPASSSPAASTEAAGARSSAPSAPANAPTPAAPPVVSDPAAVAEVVDLRVPSVGESVTEGILTRWMAADGAAVAMDQPLFELETDKVSSEIPSPAAGTLRRGAREGETVAVGAVVGRIEAASGQAPPAAAGGSAPGEAASGRTSSGVEVSSLARRIAEEEGLNLAHLRGTGPGGRIMKTDVVRALAERRGGAAAASRGAAPAPAASSPTATPAPSSQAAPRSAPAPAAVAAPPGDRPVRRQPMTMLRRRIAERLLQSQQSTATLTTFNEVDMSAIMALRKKHKDAFEKRHGVGLGFMSFFVKAVVDALRAWPAVNARIDGNDLVFHEYYDVGVAVSTDKGLVVPVVRDADRLSFAGIERRIAELATRARDGAIDLADLQGGTFTITNGGVFGSLLATPIINPPQAGILGMHTIKERPVAVDGQVVIRPMMYVALSYDHRIIDGRESVGFLVHVKNAIENPERLLLEL